MSWPIRVYWRSPRSHLSRRSLISLSFYRSELWKLIFVSKNIYRVIRPGRKTLRFNLSARNRVNNDGSRKGSSRRSRGKGVQVLVRYLRPFILSIQRLWSPLASHRSSNLRPTVRNIPGPAASSTWKKPCKAAIRVISCQHRPIVPNEMILFLFKFTFLKCLSCRNKG